MPLYEYRCDACGRRFEKIRRFSDSPLERCDLCGKGPVHKLLSSPAIQFKGSGWYITDYAKKGSSDTADSGAPSTGATPSDKNGQSAGKTEPASADTKAKPAKSDAAPKKS